MKAFFPPIANIEDVENIEKVPLEDRLDLNSTREVFERSSE